MWTTTSRACRTRSARGAFPRLSRIASLTACSAVLLAGCGGGEPAGIPPETAEALAASSELVADALAEGDPCRADRLADELVEASAGADVPEPYRGRLLASARSLADRIECPPPPPPAPAAEERDDDGGGGDDDGDDDDDDEGKGKGKGKKGRGRG